MMGLLALLRAHRRAPKLPGGGRQQQKPIHHIETTRTKTQGRVTDSAMTTCVCVSFEHFLHWLLPSEFALAHQLFTVRAGRTRRAFAKPLPMEARVQELEMGTLVKTLDGTTVQTEEPA